MPQQKVQVRFGNKLNELAWFDPVGGALYQTVKLIFGDTGSANMVSASTPLPITATGTITLSSLPAGTANIGDVDIASIAAGDNNIGNVDIVTLPALPAGSNSIGTVVDGGSGKTLKTAAFSLNATGTVVSAVADKRIKVYSIKLVASAAISVSFRSGAANSLEGAQPLGANAIYTEAVNPPTFLLATVAGESLDLVITGVGIASGRVSYWDDDAS